MDVPAWALSNLCIGRSYDSKTNQAGIDIFHPEIITKTENVNQFSFQYKFIESKKDVRDLLNISGGVSLKIKANIFKVEGTGKYINNNKQDKGVAEILAVVKCTTVNKTMDGSASAKQEMINSPGLGTHYVRSVTYGAEMVASLKFKSSSSSAKRNVKGKFDGGRDILGVATAGLEAQLNKLISDFDEASDLSIEYYATVIPDKNPTNLKDLVKLIQEFPSRLKRFNDGLGVPIKIELQPIENVYPELGSVSSIQAMECDLDEIESRFDDLTEAQRLVSEYKKKGSALDGEMKKFNSLIAETLRTFRSAISSLDKKRVEECLEAYRTSLDGKDYDEKFATHWKEILAKKTGNGGKTSKGARKMSKQLKTIHLFNCDRTYNLDVVEDWLNTTQSKLGFAFKVEKHNFLLSNMAEMSSKTIPQLDMEIAVFVVHAHESRLSINEENAGIGYAKLYKALLEKTDNKVLIVIGGDDNYKDESEEDGTFISRWARRKISSQFSDEFIDGRKSFIFSWNKRHRPIHEDALIHFFNSREVGEKFKYQPKRERFQDSGAKQSAKADESTWSQNPAEWQSKQRLSGRDTRKLDSLNSADKSTASDPYPVTSCGIKKRENDPLYTEKEGGSHSTRKSDPLSGTHPLQNTFPNVSPRMRESLRSDKESSSHRVEGSSPSSGFDPQPSDSFTSAAHGGCAAHNSHVASKISDVSSQETNQNEIKDLSIIGWEASQESLWAVKELIDRYRDVLDLITEPEVLNLGAYQMKSCFESKPFKYCVLVADAEKIKAVLTQEGEVNLKLLQTAVRNVAEKIILTICLPRCRPDRDKPMVRRAIKAAFNDNKKVYITWFENGKLVTNINELVTFLTSSNTSPQEKSYFDYLGPGKTVLVRTRLRNGRISRQPEDVEYWKPGFIVPREIVIDHAKYTNAELVILSDESGSLTCQVNEKKGEERPDRKDLDSDETIVLETKLKHGQIPNECIHQVPQHVRDHLKETYRETPAADLCITSNSKGGLRCNVKVGKVSNAFTFINFKFKKASGKKVNLI